MDQDTLDALRMESEGCPNGAPSSAAEARLNGW